MALLQRQPINLRQELPYTLSLSKNTLLIVGLGNIGKKYVGTRHNVGFIALDNFATANGFEPWQSSDKFKGQITERVLGQNRVILLKPTTYMNLSGDAVRAVANYYRINPASITVVYDELSIPFGQIRTRVGGQSAGHNGIKSLIEQLGDGFGRIRIGIKNSFAKDTEASDFVLAKFSKEETAKLPDIINETSSIITEFIFGGALKEETRKIDVGP